MFTKAGFDVDIQKFNAGSAVTAALVGGAVDIGKADLLPLIAARSRGIPLQLVAPCQLWLTEKPISGMVVLKESKITTGKDLNGTTLAAPGLLDLIQTSTRAWTDAHGGDSKTLKFVELPSSASLEALIGGRIAAAALSAPYFGNAIASGKVRVLCHPDDAIAKRFMLSGWFASEAFIDKNRDVLARFVQIVEQAGAYTNAHNAETLAMSAQFTGIEPAVLGGMTRAFVASSVDPKDVQPLVDAAVKYGVIAKPVEVQQLISSVALRPR